MEIIEKTTLEAWKSALRFITSSPDSHKEPKSTRKCIEILNLKVTITDPSIDVTAPIDILNSLQKWVYPSLSEISNVVFSKNTNPVYEYSYGHSLFNYRGSLNQLDDYIIPLLKSNPSTRRATASLWDPLIHSSLKIHQSPGLVFLDFKLRNNKLHLTAIVRSNDIFFGWPANIYQIFLIQDYVRQKVGCEFGELTTFSTSAHVFDDQIEWIKKVL